MKLKLAAAAVAMVVSQGAFAFSAPQVCPAVEQLQSNGVTMAMQNPDNAMEWAGINMSNTFGTSDNWTFVAGPATSQNQEDALAQINQKISSLAYLMGPVQSNQNSNEYACLYTNQANDFYGITITPAISPSKGFGYIAKMKK